MKNCILFFLFSCSCSSFALECHPQINSKLPQYIVGYGSLIDETSKKSTDPTAGDNVPVLIKGYERSWAAHGNLPGANTTFLAVSKDEKSSFNGVIYRLNRPEHMQDYDKREAVYCREKLDSNKIISLSTKLPAAKEVWIYIPSAKKNQQPSKEYPIVQSYVDVFLRGCIQIEEQFKLKNFAKQCIQTTTQWPNYWINDRIFPRRPFLYEPYAAQIDALVKELLPEQFKHICFEKVVM